MTSSLMMYVTPALRLINFSIIIVVVVFFKGLELVMTPNITTLRKQVAEVLDLDLLRTQAEHDAVDVMVSLNYVWY